jgi:NADH dehydrogenase
MALPVCVLGGTGFIGRALVARLAADGHSVKVLARDRTSHRDLLVMPSVRLVRADVHEPAVLEREFRGCEVVVNLVGILNERRLGHGSREFRRAHVELPMKVVAACRASGVRRYLHMSGLKADAEHGPSNYLKSKGEAEDFVRRDCTSGGPEFVIFRPSVVFGPQDEFFNKFASVLRLAPGALPLACADSKFAPVYVGDVVEAFVRCLERRDAAGRTYQLCGPEVVTLGDIVRITAESLGLRRWVIPLPRGAARLQAAIMDYVPGKPFSTDNFLSATVDSVCDRDGLGELGITRTSMRGVVPRYLRANFGRG